MAVASTSGRQNIGAHSGNSAYFDKKGEVNELRQLLRSVAVQNNIVKARDAVKKTIAYMTLGIDVSRLFSDMIMLCHSRDPVLKKMIYLYLTNYAEYQSDLAILAVNTLQKDCRDEDPTIRGLALRSLCSLRLPNMLEYVEPAIMSGMRDTSGYVRKTAVMGCAKLYMIAPDHVEPDGDKVEILHTLLDDPDPAVVVNAISALDNILEHHGGIAITKDRITGLLNRILDFSKWGQCAVLRLVQQYEPENDEEKFDVMNILEGLMKQQSAGVCLAACKLFIDYSEGDPELQRQVLERIKAPLLTLSTTTHAPELCYTVLVHVRALARHGSADIWQEDYKRFFCLHNDPSYIKEVKIDILTLLASEENFQQLVAELSEYVTDVDADMGRKAIRAIGGIAMRLQNTNMILEQLIGFLHLGIDYISTETMIVLRDLLRKFTTDFANVIPSIESCVDLITEPNGRAALIWILGEYGENIPDTPYILEPIIDSFDEETSALVQLELITASVKMFFKKAPEMQAMLGRLFSSALADNVHPDVRDRALLYYRLLSHSVHDARRVINCPKTVVSHFSEDQDDETHDRIFREFNTLAIVYGKPSHQFIIKPKTYDDDFVASSPKPPPPPPPPPAQVANLLEDDEDSVPQPGGGDFLDDMGASTPAAPSATTDLDLMALAGGNQIGVSSSRSLDPNATIDPQEFQTCWQRDLPSARKERRTATPLVGNVTTADIEAACKASGIKMMASGQLDGALKFYFYARETSNPANPSLYLVEMLLATVPGNDVEITLATQENIDAESISWFMKHLWTALDGYHQM